MKIQKDIRYLVAVCLFVSSCNSYLNSPKNEEKLYFEKVYKSKQINELEFSWIEFNVFIQGTNKMRYPISLDGLSFNCYTRILKSDSIYQYAISNFKDIQSSIPIFIIENEKGELKYFLNRRKFKTPVYKDGFRFDEPLRSDINPCGISFHNNLNVKGESVYIGKIKIYDYDLKINDNDSLVKLHYLHKKKIISSNWISI